MLHYLSVTLNRSLAFDNLENEIVNVHCWKNVLKYDKVYVCNLKANTH